MLVSWTGTASARTYLARISARIAHRHFARLVTSKGRFQLPSHTPASEPRQPPPQWALAQVEAEATDFGWLTDRIVELANDHADGRIVALLEGGYDLTGLTESLAAHIAGLTVGL